MYELKPRNLGEYIGQKRVRNNISICLETVKQRSLMDPLDHILLCGAAGTGKTSLAEVIAQELYVPIHKFMGPRLKGVDSLNFLSEVKPSEIVFIDEIHALPRKVEETLYEPLDSRKLNGTEINPFTLIGATTKEGFISKPLHTRFTIVETLELYDTSELFGILKRSASIMKLKVEDTAIVAIAQRSRGTPRMANQLLKRISYYNSNISAEIAQKAMDNIGIDKYGFDRIDRQILKTMHKLFGNGPVGIESLANILDEDMTTIEILREPFLVKSGFVQRTAKGRILTQKGVEYARKV